MDVFKFTKTVIPVKQPRHKWLIFLLILVFIPVLLAGLALVAIIASISWAYSKITGKESFGKTAEPTEQKPRALLRRENLLIQLYEIEAWEPERALENEWYENTYDEETTLYKASTEPEIEGVHNRIISTFVMERDNGILLQRITDSGDTNPKEIGSELIWVDYNDLKIKAVELVGAFFLYVENGVVKGFNKKESIEIQVGPKLQ